MSEAITRIPDSVLPYPEGLSNQTKFILWRIASPFFAFFQTLGLKMGILRHEGRQDFVIGRLAPGRTIPALLKHLVEEGYANHFIAWKDDGQIISLRKLESFERQYHVRVFEDGEIRGHYEYTPECHPVLHVKEVDMEERREVFMNAVKDWIA